MLKIGDFSRLGQVTIKTLRHYDQIGLLKPADIDPFTGYRYYRASQLADLNRILVLKEFGLSLDHIQRLLEKEISTDEMRGILKMQQSELEQRIQDEQTRLARLEARLKWLDTMGQPPEHEVVIKQVTPIRVLSLRQIIPNPTFIKTIFQEVARAIRRESVSPIGPWQALYYHDEYREYDLDFEAAIPIAESHTTPLQVNEEQWMEISELPAATLATILCCLESQIDVRRANQALCTWIDHNNYHILNAPCREVYPEAPRPNEPIYFEIQVPVSP